CRLSAEGRPCAAATATGWRAGAAEDRLIGSGRPSDDVVLSTLAEQIRRWLRADGLVFSSISARPLTKSIAGHMFDDIEEATGLVVSPHSCRHYIGSSLISQGVSVVASQGGWATHRRRSPGASTAT
ncbi:MAG TPA: tyrosine-type recombinase/integrase, partial [Jatrophihabitantaceae bacterium]|nr:tyrosine-type recombinase/integrase [Jatrophihabitantaceae bacterium]